MRLYFDTNIYNRLLDDPAMNSIVPVLAHGPHEIHVSALNIIEMAATPDPHRREALLQSANRLIRGNLPVDYPRNLLRRSLEHFVKGETGFSATIRPEDANILRLLREPACIKAKWLDDVGEWKKKEESWYHGMHKDARDGLQALIHDLSPTDFQRITANGHSFIRNVCDRPEFLEDFLGNFFAQLGYGETLKGRGAEVLHNVSVWCFYFKALAYGVYDRAIKPEHYGKKSNPGSIDVQQMIYLAGADCFTTDEKRLLQLGRELVDAFHPEKRVISYEELKIELLKQA
jgi:hypothetical protein